MCFVIAVSLFFFSFLFFYHQTFSDEKKMVVSAPMSLRKCFFFSFVSIEFLDYFSSGFEDLKALI